MTELWSPATVALLLGEHRAGDPQVVLEALEALLQGREREAVGIVLALEPGRADAVKGPTARDHVERRGDLGVLRRISVGHAAHQQAQPNRPRPRGDAGEHRVALEHPVLRRADPRDLVVVVHQRHGREARPLRRRGHLDEPVEDLLRGHAGIVEVRKVEVQLDGRSHPDDVTRVMPASRV